MHLLRSLTLCGMTCLIPGWLAFWVSAQANNERELKSLYIVTHVFSDASPFWFEYVLDVKPRGKDVLVREIRIAPLNADCPSQVTVKAADRLVENTSVQRIARLDLCSLDTRAVASAITAAQPKGVATIFDTASHTIVALCGATEKVFEIPYPEKVDLGKLKKTKMHVASLWDLAYDIQRRAFGKKFSFYNASPSQDEAFQALGAEIAPEIRSGIYDRDFQDKSRLSSLLSEYSGPAKQIDPWRVEFGGPVPADLSQYELPKYPVLAKQARIEGEVRLVVALDTHTGRVKDVIVASGKPLLAKAAQDAVRDWHFQEGVAPKDSVELALRFTLRCPSR